MLPREGGREAVSAILCRKKRTLCAAGGEEPAHMPTTNVVNLDALIRRADLAAPSEASEDITALPIMGLEQKGLLFPALRKPDFQRETANWSCEQVADLILPFCAAI
jgi:hypothetical protein